MKYLIDTDILIDILRGVRGSKEFILDLWNKGELCVTLINIMEIMSGKETRVREKREKIMEFLSEFTVLDFDKERAVLAGEIRRDYGIPFADAIIAAIATSSGECTLVTYNERHFRKIKELNLLVPKYRQKYRQGENDKK